MKDGTETHLLPPELTERSVLDERRNLLGLDVLNLVDVEVLGNEVVRQGQSELLRYGSRLGLCKVGRCALSAY